MTTTLGVHRDSESEPIRGQLSMIEAAVRGPASERVHVPGTAPQTAPRLFPVVRDPGGTVIRRAGVVVVPNVGAPLPHVAENVVQPPRVRPLQSDRLGALAAVQVEPRVFT